MKYLFFTIFLLSCQGWTSEDKSTSVVRSIEKNLAPKNFKAIYAFTNYRTDGTIMNYEVRFTVKDVNNSHGYFVKPEREKGREILRQKDVIWTFIPSVGKAVRVADRESFAGGDFSNADVLRVDWLNQYKPKMTKETANQWIIDLTAIGPDATYAKMRLWVDKKDSQPVQQYFYDSSGTLLKRLLYGSVKKFDSIARPTRLVMENVITKQKSEMKVIEMTLDQKVPDSRFRVDNLGK
jgi:outer membrane lipoprotein-sorting protein